MLKETEKIHGETRCLLKTKSLLMDITSGKEAATFNRKISLS